MSASYLLSIFMLGTNGIQVIDFAPSKTPQTHEAVIISDETFIGESQIIEAAIIEADVKLSKAPTIDEYDIQLDETLEETAVRVAGYFKHDLRLRQADLSPKDFEALFIGMIKAESYFDAEALSEKGAIGLAQLMPGTADDLKVNPYDIEENLHGGAEYLVKQLARFRNVDHALAAYNAGPDRVIQYGGIPPFKETQEYIERINRFLSTEENIP